VRARTSNEEMELAAAQAIARVIPDDEPHADCIVPSVFNHRVTESVAEAVANAAVASGVARRERGARTSEPATPLEALR
jgi:malate dehydrogenase (oxaloacetate-decarboxylating)